MREGFGGRLLLSISVALACREIQVSMFVVSVPEFVAVR